MIMRGAAEGRWNRRLTEIETLVAHSENGAKNLEAMGQPREAFLRATPPADRMSRADLVRVANMYFSGMQLNDGKGNYPFADDCDRIENGGKTTNAPAGRGGTPRPDPKTATGYSAMWTCREQFESGLLHFVMPHPRSPLPGRRRGARPGRRVRVLRSRRRRVAHFKTPDGRSVTAGPTVAVDVGDCRVVQGGEGPAPRDRGHSRARALRHDVGLEQLGRRDVGQDSVRSVVIGCDHGRSYARQGRQNDDATYCSRSHRSGWCSGYIGRDADAQQAPARRRRRRDRAVKPVGRRRRWTRTRFSPGPGPSKKSPTISIMIPGQGGNTAVYVAADGVVLVDTKNPTTARRSSTRSRRSPTSRSRTSSTRTRTAITPAATSSSRRSVEIVVAGEHQGLTWRRCRRSRRPPTRHGLPDRTFKDKMTRPEGQGRDRSLLLRPGAHRRRRVRRVQATCA